MSDATLKKTFQPIKGLHWVFISVVIVLIGTVAYLYFTLQQNKHAAKVPVKHGAVIEVTQQLRSELASMTKQQQLLTSAVTNKLAATKPDALPINPLMHQLLKLQILVDQAQLLGQYSNNPTAALAVMNDVKQIVAADPKLKPLLSSVQHDQALLKQRITHQQPLLLKIATLQEQLDNLQYHQQFSTTTIPPRASPHSKAWWQSILAPIKQLLHEAIVVTPNQSHQAQLATAQQFSQLKLYALGQLQIAQFAVLQQDQARYQLALGQLQRVLPSLTLLDQQQSEKLSETVSTLLAYDVNQTTITLASSTEISTLLRSGSKGPSL